MDQDEHEDGDSSSSSTKEKPEARTKLTSRSNQFRRLGDGTLGRQVNFLSEELERERERGKSWEDEKLALESLIRVQAQDLAEKQEQFEEKNKKYKKYKGECWRITEELETLRETQENAESLKQELSEREKEVEEKNDQIQTAQSEVANLKAQLGELETTNKDLKESLQRSNADWSKKISKLEKTALLRVLHQPAFFRRFGNVELVQVVLQSCFQTL